MATYTETYLNEARTLLHLLDVHAVEAVAKALLNLKKTGARLFFLGVGGSAANCSHAVNDFRKIAGIEAYTPTDNVAELSARTNDEGWETTFSAWLKVSKLASKDMVFILSVGGGDLQKNISPNIVKALEYAVAQEASIVGIVGRDGGHTKKVADHCILIPCLGAERITPHVEALQGLILHLLVTHPTLKLTN